MAAIDETRGELAYPRTKRLWAGLNELGISVGQVLMTPFMPLLGRRDARMERKFEAASQELMAKLGRIARQDGEMHLRGHVDNEVCKIGVSYVHTPPGGPSLDMFSVDKRPEVSDSPYSKGVDIIISEPTGTLVIADGVGVDPLAFRSDAARYLKTACRQLDVVFPETELLEAQ